MARWSKAVTKTTAGARRRLQPPGHLEPGQPGHLDVEEHHVGLEARDDGPSASIAVAGLADHLDAVHLPSRKHSSSRASCSSSTTRAVRWRCGGHRHAVSWFGATELGDLDPGPGALPGAERGVRQRPWRRRSRAAARSRCSGRCRSTSPSLPGALRDAQPVVLDLDDRGRSRAAADRDAPPPTLRDSPCLIEFSTSGCSIMLGTMTSSVSGSTVLATVSRGPKRMTSMSRYSSMASSSSRSVTNCSWLRSSRRSRPESFCDDHARRLGLRADERRDRRQRVEQEVRVDLALERLDRAASSSFSCSWSVLDARVVPDLDRNGHASTVASTTSHQPGRSSRSQEEQALSPKRAERLPEQLEPDRARAAGGAASSTSQRAHHAPEVARQAEEDERREAPDVFLRAGLAQAAAGEAAADGEGQGAELAGHQGRQAHHGPTIAPA
jgi:hypothetical protein